MKTSTRPGRCADFEPQGWHDTTSETFVRFNNRAKRFKDDAVAYRARCPLYPHNLRVNGDGLTATCRTEVVVSVNWDRSDPRRNAEGPTETLTPAISRTVVKLLTVGGL